MIEYILKDEMPDDYRRQYDKLGISRRFGQILYNRAIMPRDADRLLNNPLALIDDMPDNIYGAKEAALKILENLANGAKFLVFADYDVDGMVSGYIMTDFLRKVGADIYCYYPERSEGYGLSMEFAKAIDYDDGPWCVITVDNGITALEPIEYIISKDADVVVTDHHEPGIKLPNCTVCDPWIDKNYGTHLCGAGVAWKICMLMESVLEETTSALTLTEEYIPFLGIATIADVMPMSLENRAIIKLALEKMNSNDPGTYMSILKKMFSLYNVTAKDIGWTIAPVLNGASRMGDTQSAAESFYETDEDDLSETFIKLNKYNRSRKTLQDKAVKEATKNDYADDDIILFDASDYPPGLYGIVASKLAELNKKPAIVYCSDDSNILSGSCRTYGDIDIKSLINIETVKGNAYGAAGHHNACGCNLMKDKLDDFKQGVHDSLNGIYPEELLRVESKILQPVDHQDIPDSLNDIQVDCEIIPAEITADLLSEINQIPFYKDEPLFILKNMPVNMMHPFKNKNHLVLKLGNTVALGWNMTELFPGIENANKINILGKISNAGFSAKYFGLNRYDAILMIENIDIVE